jgi:hypothetical protein
MQRRNFTCRLLLVLGRIRITALGPHFCFINRKQDIAFAAQCRFYIKATDTAI